MLSKDLTVLALILFSSATSYALPAPGGREPSQKQDAKRAVPKTLGKLAKRANPTIGNGIDTSDPLRGGKLISAPGSTDGAFSTAFELMSYATTLPATTTDPIFNKYFNPEDKQTVNAVFAKLLGPDGVNGAAELANIVVTAGDPSDEDPAPAELINYDTQNPSMLLDDDAFVYPNRDEATGCDEWDEEGMTQDMYLLGSIILHEYTHWDWFLQPITGGEVIDQPNGYGWEGARALSKDLAKYNADSYAWYATELLWAVLCEHDGGYNAPGVEKRK